MTDLAPIFDPAALRKYVDQQFAAVPSHHGCARVRVTVNGEISVTVAARVNDHWLIQGQAAWDFAKDSGSAQFEVLASW